jgi:hypothetical protein
MVANSRGTFSSRPIFTFARVENIPLVRSLLITVITYDIKNCSALPFPAKKGGKNSLLR